MVRVSLGPTSVTQLSDAARLGEVVLNAEPRPTSFASTSEGVDVCTTPFPVFHFGDTSRLTDVNVVSRVGTSTLARRYADEYPGCPRLDLDRRTGLSGGWREDISAAVNTAWPLGFGDGHRRPSRTDTT